MKKFMRFFRDDDGMEFIQVAFIVVGVVALAAGLTILLKNVYNSVSAVDPGEITVSLE